MNFFQDLLCDTSECRKNWALAFSAGLLFTGSGAFASPELSAGPTVSEAHVISAEQADNASKASTKITPTALTATIFNASFSSTVDTDSDGFFSSGNLVWDPDVAGGSGELDVFEKIYWKPSSSSSWTLAATTAVHTITDTSSADAYFVTITSGIHNTYDWKIEIYRDGLVFPDYTRSNANDLSLSDVPMERAGEDSLSGPDLTLSFSIPLTLSTKGKYFGQVNAQNVGNVLAIPSYMEVWFLDSLSNFHLLKRTKVSKLLPGVAKLKKINVKPPFGVSWSGGRILVVGDSGDFLNELDETNNSLWTGILP
ncbi:MAG: choice-of-anchor H family protein [Candidatus Sumerlaeaceae bacterium]